MQQHRVGPMGSSPKGQGGARKEVNQRGGDHGPLMERDFPGPPNLLGQFGGGGLGHHQPPSLNWTTGLAAPGPGDPREVVQSLR